MRTLTLHQPYAAAMAGGFKRFETRSWKTSYRGPIAIHAAKKPLDPKAYEALAQQVNAAGSRKFPALASLSYGGVVAVGVLRDCIEMTEAMIAETDPVEKLLGDWQPGRYGWLITNLKKFETAPEARGQQGLWDWDIDDDFLAQQATIPLTDDTGLWLTPAQRVRFR